MNDLNYKLYQLGLTDRQIRLLSDRVKRFVEEFYEVIPHIKASIRKSFPKVKDELKLIFHTIDYDFIDDEHNKERRRIIETEIRNYKLSKLLGERKVCNFSEFKSIIS